MTAAAVLTLATSCQSLVAPVTILKIATHESRLDPAATHRNADGSTDWGLMQINDRNFQWLGLTIAAALDPCRSIAAGAAVLAGLSKYNTGSPARGIGYAAAVQAVRIGPAQQSADVSTPRDGPSNNPFAKPARTGRDLVFTAARMTP